MSQRAEMAVEAVLPPRCDFALQVPCPLSGSSQDPHRPKSRERRIFGGSLTDIKTYPYIVSVQDLDGHLCAGTIVTESIILTAAHCVDHPISVVAGSSYVNSGGSWHNVTESIVHEDFIPNTFDHDIALLKLDPAITINNKTTKKVQFFQCNDIEVKHGTKATVVGWGMTREYPSNGIAFGTSWESIKSIFDFNSGELLEQLNQVGLEIISKKECQRLLPKMNLKQQLCAYFPDKKHCEGDSGGPLMVDQRQVGIVSAGSSKCTNQRSVGIYTEVAAYHYWIHRGIRTLTKSQNLNLILRRTRIESSRFKCEEKRYVIDKI
ncbi:hypothetical protein QAD02_003790 [Eretmocerus hayati]|uniref:Uncharacterized protein n=1 Tax=Eretmocerus hayati TaxID=131215 RepID=A0ACC2NN16_9HYME|nr:hypothetical protein QAD02_003790 [Eretmocerus hayati]